MIQINGKTKMTIEIPCLQGHHKISTVPMTFAQLTEFISINPRHVQIMFSELTATQREVLITGFCEECQDKIFVDNEPANEVNTYVIIDVNGISAIRCLVCGFTSYNENDIKNKYCGSCHRPHPINDVPIFKIPEDNNEK